MTKVEKQEQIDSLAEQLQNAPAFYLTDTSELSAEKTSELRRACFKKDITLKVVKNTLLQKAFEKMDNEDYSEFFDLLKGPTSVMFTEVGNAPAKLIDTLRKKSDRPILKGAYIEQSVYIGDDKLKTLCDLKSKEELLGDIIALLQSPAKNLVSALQSGKNTLAGLVKTLQEK